MRKSQFVPPQPLPFDHNRPDPSLEIPDLAGHYHSQNTHTTHRPLGPHLEDLDAAGLKSAYRRLEQQHAQTQKRLRQAEALRHGYFDHSPDAIIIVRQGDGAVLEVNPRFTEMSGYAAEEVLGRTTVELGLWESAETYQHLCAKLTAESGVQNVETRFIFKADRRMHALVSTVNLAPKSINRLMMVIRDIDPVHTTKAILRGHREALQLQNDWLQRVQHDLSKSRLQYQDLFEAAPVGYCTLNRWGVILEVNQTGAEMFGKATEALCGTPMGDLVARGYRKIVAHHLERVIHYRQKTTCEVKLASSAGPPRYFRLISSAVPDDEGGFKHCRTAFLDETERRRAQASLAVANRFLSIANRLRDVDDTLKEFLSEMKRSTDCEALGIRMLTSDGHHPMALSVGFPDPFLHTEKALCSRNGSCLCNRIGAQKTDPERTYFTANGSFFSPHFSDSLQALGQDPEFNTNGTCPQMGFETLAIIPIRSGDAVLGLVMAADMRPDALDDHQVSLLENAALQLGNSIRRARVEEALRHSHDELEARVASRTAEVVETNTRLQEQITWREQAEQRLRQSRQRLQKVFDGISDPLVLTDVGMNVQMINQAAQRYYELASTTDVAGLQCHRVFHPHTEACTACPIPDAVAKGNAMEFEREGFKDAARTEKVVIYPLEDPKDHLKGAVIRIQDITDEKAMERQLIQSEKLASLGTLVSSVAHEINNPNSFISFNMPILRDYLDALLPITDAHAATREDLELFHMPYREFRADLLRMIDNIEHGSQRINAFLANLREFSAARPAITFKPVNLPDLVEKALALVGTKVRKTVRTLDVHMAPDLPEVCTDESALEQILVNLLVNAAQATDKPTAWVRLEAQPDKTNNNHVLITVSDNGCGMTEAVQSQIFDPFYSTKINEGGTGLGLYVCRKLIQQLGGRIELESALGEGSRFMVTLPGR